MSLYKSIIGVFLQNHLQCRVRVVGSIYKTNKKKEVPNGTSFFTPFLSQAEHFSADNSSNFLLSSLINVVRTDI